MTQHLEFVNPGGNLTLTESEIVAKNLDKVHTGVGDARVDVPQNDAIIPYVQRQDRINYYVGGNVVFTGYVVGFQGNELTGKWTLRVDGIGKRLEETRPDYESIGGELVYTNIALDDAIEDYWSRTPFSATTTEQSPELIAEDELLQSADTTAEWGAVYTPADTEPIVIQNGNLELAQICWTSEGEDDSDRLATTTYTGTGFEDYSGGTARGFSDLASSVGAYIEWDFTPAHTIPEEHVSVQVRDDNQDGDDTPEVDWTLNGSRIDTLPQGADVNLSWTDVGNGSFEGGRIYDGGDLEAGTTYTLRAEVQAISSDQSYAIDVVAPYDGRFESDLFFDNDNGNSSGYLDGPELYPESYSVELNEQQTAYNIASADVTTTWNDTTNNQAIAISNDGGASYTIANNAQTLSVDFAASGRAAQTKLTLSRYGSRTSATPQTGFNGQLVQDYSLEVDLTNLVVIDRLELSRDHFANLKQLHDYGDFLWVIEHDSGDLDTLSVSSFARGQETRTSPPEFSDVENIKPEVAAENYFNSVYLEGALQSDGTRPTATVKSDSAIAEDRDEITPGVLRDQSISTESGAQFRANALLSAALENNALRGTIETSPVYVQPGFSYPVDFGEGEAEKTLESVSITESAGEIQATYPFVTREELSNTLDDLKREGRTIGNEV